MLVFQMPKCSALSQCAAADTMFTAGWEKKEEPSSSPRHNELPGTQNGLHRTACPTTVTGCAIDYGKKSEIQTDEH